MQVEKAANADFVLHVKRHKNAILLDSVLGFAKMFLDK